MLVTERLLAEFRRRRALADLLSAEGTRTSATPPSSGGVEDAHIDELVEDVGFLRSRARLLGEDVDETARQAGSCTIAPSRRSSTRGPGTWRGGKQPHSRRNRWSWFCVA